MVDYGLKYDDPIVFPSEQSRAFEDVKLWFGFNVKPYSNRRTLRAKVYSDADGIRRQVPGRGAKPLTKIYLPMPVNLASKTNIAYTAEETTQTALGEAFFGAGVDLGDRAGNLFSTLFLGAVGELLPIANPLGLVVQDNLDATFDSAVGRTFTFKYTLIAKDPDEASLISDICQQFKIFSLPTQTEVPTRVIQPPLWSWDGYKYLDIPRDEQNMDVPPAIRQTKEFKQMSIKENQTWNDDAQTSVLTSVDIDRTGAGGIHPIGVGKGFLPIVTTLTLTFVELEPLVRLSTSGIITNRSGAQLSAQLGGFNPVLYGEG